MRLPIINTDPDVMKSVTRTLSKVNRAVKASSVGDTIGNRIDLVQLDDHDRAIEYINYQLPPLIIINFSDDHLNGFGIMRQVTSDPWLNHGGIIAFYTGSNTFKKINELKNTNIIIHLHYSYIPSQLGTVLGIIRDNQQILFQRAIQTDLISSLSGQFVLTMDTMLIPCYANLIANYLFNVGFLDHEGTANVSLVLTEMLTNAIEHGNCGISWAEKEDYLKEHSSVQDLIAKKCRDARIRNRKVYFNYDIHRSHSSYVIRDEGDGFAWQQYTIHPKEVDFLSEHGRGILLAKQHVDTISYNEKGNEATLTFRHRINATSSIPQAFKDNEVVECRRDDVIFNQGEASDFLYYVAEGEYRVEVNNHHVAILTPDDILIGEMSFLLEETRSATVIANTPGRLIKISKESFINIIRDQPYYGLFLSKLIAKRLHRLSRGVLS